MAQTEADDLLMQDNWYAGTAGGWRAAVRAIAPRKKLSVSEWADAHRVLSGKGSAEPGRWNTSRNEALREPMDCMSVKSSVREVVCVFPIQLGKTEVAINTLGYCMDHDPGPIMVCLPSEVSMNKWVAQKLHPSIEESPAMRDALSSVASRDAANTRTFKDFAGGQLYMEHAGSPSRLKSTSVRTLIVDEVDEFSACFTGGDDPVDMLLGRTSAFPATYKRLFISTPQNLATSRIWALWLKSDMRRRYLPCPHCGHSQYLQWSGLQWMQASDGRITAWYVCQECGSHIDERYKQQMLGAGAWVAGHPQRRRRGYHINALYHPVGLGPRWADLVEMWLEAQDDPARLKTFVNDRLAEAWEDGTTQRLKHEAIADRAENYPLRAAPEGVISVTAGVDTQDDRLAVQIVGWGQGMRFWVLDYVELPGDPAAQAVWVALTELLNRPIQHAGGGLVRVQAYAQDAAGHRTEAVKNYVAQKLVQRPMAIFGSKLNNAPVLSRPKLQDLSRLGRGDRRGVATYQVGTVAAKHHLYGVLSADGHPDVAAPERMAHFSDQLDQRYFSGLVGEVFNPKKNRFENPRGSRNEPLDTWVYAFAAAHHPELRLNRRTKADWEMEAQRVRGQVVLPPLATPAAPAAPSAAAAPAAPSAAAARSYTRPAQQNSKKARHGTAWY